LAIPVFVRSHAEADKEFLEFATALNVSAGGMLVAGGTDLYPNMKRRQFEPKTLVGLRAIKDLRGVSGTARDGVTIGACTTLTTVATHPAIARNSQRLRTGRQSATRMRKPGQRQKNHWGNLTRSCARQFPSSMIHDWTNRSSKV